MARLNTIPCRRSARALVFAAGWLAAGAFAQPEPPAPATAPPADRVSPELEPFEGRPLRRVRFIIPTGDPPQPQPLDPATNTLARNQLRLLEGAPFSSRSVSEDIARLTRLGRFRRVESRVQMLGDGGVELTYIVTLQPVVTAVQTVGNTVFSDEKLLPGVDLIGTPVDPTQLERACRLLEERYRTKGYYNALVTVDEKELETSGIVLFKIREGERTRVTEIRFEGARVFTARQLKRVVKTKTAWLLKRGEINNDQLDEDVAALIGYYRDRGYLDVRADRIITPSPNGREAIVTFVIDEGPNGQVTTLREVRLEIAEGEESVFTIEQLRALLVVKPGDAYSEDRLRRSVKSIEDAYGQLGYADAKVNRQRLWVPDQALADLILIVSPGQRFKTGMVEIQGNTGTRDNVIREQLTLVPDRPLDTTEIEESRKRVQNLRIFEPRSVKFSIQPEREDEPGYRDVLVEVGETSTGSFNIGAGVNSDLGVTAQIGVTQRNFDITDWPSSWGEFWRGDAFHGGGQTLSLQAMPGDKVRIFTISLTDPFIAGSDYSGQASAYFRDRIYSAYDERRIGVRFVPGRRFGSRWAVSAPIKAESIELASIDDDAPTDYFEVEDKATLFSAGLTLTRSDTDSVTFPSKGSKAEIGIEQFTGDFSFARIGGEYSRYFKIDEDALGMKTVLQLTTKAAFIPQDSEDVPFYERLYLGGQSFRGFDVRAVAPIGIRNDNGEVSDETVGGNFMFFLGAEVRKPLFTDLVSGVVFIDSGTVAEDIGFDEYRVSAGFGLRIYVEQLSQVPLAFDFGFPLMKEETDETRIFTFSLDIPFR